MLSNTICSLKDGIFSLKSAYMLARNLNPLNLVTNPIAWVWKVVAPPKIQFFLWLCLHNSVPTGDVLGSRDLNIDPMFNLCQRGNETIEHLLRSCEVAQRFWQDLKFPQCLRDSFKLPFGKWLEINCQKEIRSDIMGLPWKILFVMGIWHIWLHRNEVTFRLGRVDNMSHMRCIKESVEFFSLGINCKV